MPNQTTWGRTQPATRWLLLLMTLALTATLLSVGSSPSSADHPNKTAGNCDIVDKGWANDSTVALTPFTREPGLRIYFDGHCNPGGSNTTTLKRDVVVDGTIVSRLANTVFTGGGSERRLTTELHLPVRAIHEVCLDDPDTPEKDGCVVQVPSS